MWSHRRNNKATFWLRNTISPRKHFIFFLHSLQTKDHFFHYLLRQTNCDW